MEMCLAYHLDQFPALPPAINLVVEGVHPGFDESDRPPIRAPISQGFHDSVTWGPCAALIVVPHSRWQG
jgi:hypothetical protein